MNFSPDAYNTDLTGISGVDALTTDQGTDAFETDNTALLDTLEPTDGQQTTLITVGVIGGVGLALLGINTLIGRFENRIASNTLPVADSDVVAPNSADEHIGRHKTTAALAEQQSRLAELETSTSELERADAAVSSAMRPPPAPRFTPRETRVAVPPPALPIQPRPQQLPPPPIPMPRLPERPAVTSPISPRPQTALPSPSFSPNQVEPVAAIPQAEPVSASPPSTVYKTYRVPARLAETITLTQELLEFGISLPLILQEPLPTMSGPIPAYSECLADVAAHRQVGSALALTVTACHQNGQVQPVTSESIIVLSETLTPLRPQAVQHQSSPAAPDELGSTLQETIEQAALASIENLAAEVLGDDLLGNITGAALETITEAAIADDAVPEPASTPAMPVYRLVQDTPVVVVSQAPVVPAPVIPPAVIPTARPIPAAVETPPAPAPVPDVLPATPQSMPLDAAPPTPALHPDGQPLPTLEQLLAPLPARQVPQVTTTEALPAAAGSELNQAGGETNAL
ncbi:MAG: hypothetical protein AAF959_01645 [Cyanobacteria bacterium P01_D01_bin.56]